MRSFLLDTHTWIWMLEDSARLGRRTRAILEDETSRLLMSVASAWEIATKVAAGRLSIPLRTEADFLRQLRLTGVETVDLELRHAVAAGSLPRHHGDPFDRMIVAQAQDLDAPILTVDPRIARYDVEVVAD
ncbi:MAG: type II toxin-antitoxin system VapC family toxin [Microbacterium sp.]